MPTAIINGFKHHYTDIGSGEALVMLHTAAISGKQYAPHFDDLSKDFRVLAVDMRGMGGSARVDDIPVSAWVDDVAGLLDHLGIDKAHIYGAAVGSRVAMRVALDHPHKVRSLTLDSAIMINEPAGDAAMSRNFGNMTPERAQNYRNHHGDDWEKAVTFYFGTRTKPELVAYLDMSERSKQITAPTLIMRGDNMSDPIHPLAHSVQLHANIAGSWLAVLPNRPTNVANSTPAEFRRLLREFVGSLAKVAAK